MEGGRCFISCFTLPENVLSVLVLRWIIEVLLLLLVRPGEGKKRVCREGPSLAAGDPLLCQCPSSVSSLCQLCQSRRGEAGLRPVQGAPCLAGTPGASCPPCLLVGLWGSSHSSHARPLLFLCPAAQQPAGKKNQACLKVMDYDQQSLLCVFSRACFIPCCSPSN